MDDGLPAELTHRHEEILDAALTSMSEHGVGGTSLRALAATVGMQQPSLYTYFRTKDELVEQVVAWGTRQMTTWQPELPFPERLGELPRFVARFVTELYTKPRHPRFVRFLFAASLEQPSLRPRIRQVFVDALVAASEAIMLPFVMQGLVDEERAGILGRMVTNSIALPLMEERVLLAEPTISERNLRYIAVSTEALTRLFEQIEAEGRERAGDTGRGSPRGSSSPRAK